MHDTTPGQASVPGSLRRAILAGGAGGIAWIVAMTALFGPAQRLLADPELQHPKFLQVMTLEPLPRTAESAWLLPLGLLVIGTIYGLVYHLVRPAFAGRRWWRKGLWFGVVAWSLMVPWFEFYLPWNVMREPGGLVVLEMILWLGVLCAVGLTIARVYER